MLKLADFNLVRNQRVRGPLLGSILLLADELDLHYERAPFLPARAELNDISEAHALKHRCVLGAEVVHHPGGRVGLGVTTQQFVGHPESVVESVESWIVDKLRKQIAKVDGAFAAGFSGHAQVSRVVVLRRRQSEIAVPPPSPAVLAIIADDVDRADVINHDDALHEVQQAVNARAVAVVTGRLGDDYIDRDGREDVLRSACSRAAAMGSVVLLSQAPFESHGAATLSDVLWAWCDALPNVEPGAVPHGGRRAAERALEMLCQALGDLDQHALVAASSLDRLPERDRTWLLTVAIPAISTSGEVSVLLSAEADLRRQPFATSVTWVSTGGLDRVQVSEHMARYIPWAQARGEAGAGMGYADYKRLRASHLLELEQEAANAG